jgi:hypothetical protein
MHPGTSLETDSRKLTCRSLGKLRRLTTLEAWNLHTSPAQSERSWISTGARGCSFESNIWLHPTQFISPALDCTLTPRWLKADVPIAPLPLWTLLRIIVPNFARRCSPLASRTCPCPAASSSASLQLHFWSASPTTNTISISKLTLISGGMGKHGVPSSTSCATPTRPKSSSQP